MALNSDLTVNASKFDPANASKQTIAVNQRIMDTFANGPKWYDENIGAEKYRQMRLNGETALPGPVYLPEALEKAIPSRQAGRAIPCRLVYPAARKTTEERAKCAGIFLHIHGGGWVLGNHQTQDRLLQTYADTGDLAVLSVGYRLAPEHPFPAAPEDCVDVANYLAKHSTDEFGGELKFLGGESAGGHLALLTAFHLLKTAPNVKLTGLVLHVGVYELNGFPFQHHYDKDLVLSQELISRFESAFLPGATFEDRRRPDVSPYYENLGPHRGRLPSALFTCGTDDPLLEDSVCMATRWLTHGGDGVLKIYTGACHGFISFPPGDLEEARQAMADTVTYIRQRMAATPKEA